MITRERVRQLLEKCLHEPLYKSAEVIKTEASLRNVSGRELNSKAFEAWTEVYGNRGG
jgi:hypothetical protein